MTATMLLRPSLLGGAPAHRIFENDTVLAFLDIAPQGPGHTLVIPKSGATNLFNIASDDLCSLLKAVQQVGKQLVAALGADGLEIQQLNGAAAGQTVFHLHFHLIPRFAGVPIIPHAEAVVADQTELAAMAARILMPLAKGSAASLASKRLVLARRLR